MKKKLSLIPLFLLAINSVSAYTMGNSFSIRDLFSQLNLENLIYFAIFLIVVFLVNYSLKKSIFKDQKALPAIIGMIAGIFAIYGLSRTNFHLADSIYNIGFIPDNLFPILIPIIFALFFIIIWIKVGFGVMLMGTGIIFLIMGFTEIAYNKSFSIILGAILFIIGLIWYLLRRRWKRTARVRIARRII